MEYNKLQVLRMENLQKDNEQLRSILGCFYQELLTALKKFQ